MANSRIPVRLSAEQSRKLDALAAAASTTKAQALRRLIDGADTVAEQDVEPVDVEGVRRLLSDQARRGSVPAAKALLEHQWKFEKERQADAELDQLNALAAGR
jgi:predicted DNA-binding protein